MHMILTDCVSSFYSRPSKPKGLPRLGEKLDIVSTPGETSPESVSAVSTPYRLPKLTPDGQQVENDMHQMWSRHGYDVYASK